MPFNRREAERRLRIADFARRAGGDRDGPHVHPTAGTRYVTVHPFSDETATLSRLGIRPEDCRQVDAYWEVGGDVCFLQVWTTRADPTGRLGLYARWSDGRPPMLNVVGIVDTPHVSRQAFESVMTRLIDAGVPAGEKFSPTIGDSLVSVS